MSIIIPLDQRHDINACDFQQMNAISPIAGPGETVQRRPLKNRIFNSAISKEGESLEFPFESTKDGKFKVFEIFTPN